MNRKVLIVGAVATTFLVAILFAGLGRDPQHIDSPLVGQLAPEFVLKGTGTTTMFDLHALRGKPVVINFWATWCVPCYEEHPILVETARMMGSKAQFVGVAFNDEEDKINAFLRERGASYPMLLDHDGKTAIAYGVGGVPETYFLNAQGVIVAKHEGPMSFDVLQMNLAKAVQ